MAREIKTRPMQSIKETVVATIRVKHVVLFFAAAGAVSSWFYPVNASHPDFIDIGFGIVRVLSVIVAIAGLITIISKNWDQKIIEFYKQEIK